MTDEEVEAVARALTGDAVSADCPVHFVRFADGTHARTDYPDTAHGSMPAWEWFKRRDAETAIAALDAVRALSVPIYRPPHPHPMPPPPQPSPQSVETAREIVGSRHWLRGDWQFEKVLASALAAADAAGYERGRQQKFTADAGLSWGGHVISGDRASIDAVKAALHAEGIVPALRSEILSTREERDAAYERGARDAALDAAAVIGSLPPSPATAREIIQTVAELPDRTSPDDWPEAMLVTADELRAICEPALTAADAAGYERGAQEMLETYGAVAKILDAPLPPPPADGGEG